MRERAHQLGDAFTLKRWFEEVRRHHPGFADPLAAHRERRGDSYAASTAA
jgi:hypothetical protein